MLPHWLLRHSNWWVRSKIIACFLGLQELGCDGVWRLLLLCLNALFQLIEILLLLLLLLRHLLLLLHLLLHDHECHLVLLLRRHTCEVRVLEQVLAHEVVVLHLLLLWIELVRFRFVEEVINWICWFFLLLFEFECIRIFLHVFCESFLAKQLLHIFFLFPDLLPFLFETVLLLYSFFLLLQADVNKFRCDEAQDDWKHSSNDQRHIVVLDAYRGFNTFLVEATERSWLTPLRAIIIKFAIVRVLELINLTHERASVIVTTLLLIAAPRYAIWVKLAVLIFRRGLCQS